MVGIIAQRARLGLFLSVLFTLSPALAQAPVTELLLTFEDGTATDSSGKGHSFVVDGAPSFQELNGHNAMCLDGDDSLLFTADSFLMTDRIFTWSLDVYPQNAQNGNYKGIMYLGGYAGLESTADSPRLMVRTGYQGSQKLVAIGGPHQETQKFTDQEWQRLTVTRDGTNITICNDGAVVAQTTNGPTTFPECSHHTCTAADSGGALHIGHRWPYNQYFSGCLDNVRITTGAAIYSNCFPPEPEPEPEPVPEPITLYVDTQDGSDNADGLTLGTAFKTHGACRNALQNTEGDVCRWTTGSEKQTQWGLTVEDAP